MTMWERITNWWGWVLFWAFSYRRRRWRNAEEMRLGIAQVEYLAEVQPEREHRYRLIQAAREKWPERGPEYFQAIRKAYMTPLTEHVES